MARLRHHLKNAFIPHEGNEYRPHALRHRWLHTYAGIIVGVKVVVVLSLSVFAGKSYQSDVTTANIIQLTNQARQQNKVVTLKTNPLLTKAAEAKARDMAQLHYFAHISPSGITPWTWFRQAGYSYTYAGENLAMDFVQSEDVIAAWLKSPSHRRNLLSTKYKDIGVAVATAKINGVNSILVVQMFGAPVIKPIVKPATTPVQTPLPTTVKKQIAASVPPANVLGEATPPAVESNTITQPVALITPTIVTPAEKIAVRTNQPEIIGQATPRSTVSLYVNDQAIASTTAEATGVYSLTPPNSLPDGSTQIRVAAALGQQTSQLSPIRTVIVDTVAPGITPTESYILPSLALAGMYDVAVKVNDPTVAVKLSYADQETTLIGRDGVFYGQITIPDRASISGLVTAQTTDLAGNQTQLVLADLDSVTTGVVAPTTGPINSAYRLIFFSRTFFMTFLLLIFAAAIVNVLVEWRHQHHPTIIATLLVIFLTGTVLLA